MERAFCEDICKVHAEGFKERTTRQVTKSQQCSITLGRIFILEIVRNKLDSLATTFF